MFNEVLVDSNTAPKFGSPPFYYTDQYVEFCLSFGMDFSDQYPVVQRRVMSPNLSIGF